MLTIDMIDVFPWGSLDDKRKSAAERTKLRYAAHRAGKFFLDSDVFVAAWREHNGRTAKNPIQSVGAVLREAERVATAPSRVPYPRHLRHLARVVCASYASLARALGLAAKR